MRYILICCLVVMLTAGCAAKSDTAAGKEPVRVAETVQEPPVQENEDKRPSWWERNGKHIKNGISGALQTILLNSIAP